MYKYVIKRLLLMILVIIGAAFIIFSIMYFTPGDPARQLLGEGATIEEIQAMRAKLGIDKPFLVQFGNYLYNTFIKLDLGTSWKYQVPVMDEFLKRLPRTVGMGLAKIILTTIIGIPVGIVAAKYQGRWQDYGILALMMIFVSMPNFWLGLECVLIFSVHLKWLPAYGIGGIQYYILPVIAGCFNAAATTAKQTRSSMLEIIRADFITTARAKGLSEKAITWRHMIPNALMPVITVVGGQFAHIAVGSTIFEKVFAIPGVGLYLLDGIGYRDYPVVRSCTLFFALFSAVTMLFVDLAYAWLDPRIKAQYSGKKV